MNDSDIGNRQYSLDSDLLSTILLKLLRHQPTELEEDALVLPDFRLKQLIKIATRRMQPLSERRIIEGTAAVYILCLYNFLSIESFQKQFLFHSLSLLLTLQSESLVIIQSMGGQKKTIMMSPLLSALTKDESIDSEFLLEPFVQLLDTARVIGRDLYELMKVTLRSKMFPNGQKKGINMKPLTNEEKKIQLKHMECLQPYCMYFMTSIAIGHITLMLNSVHNVTIFPGLLESLLVMLLTTVDERSHTAASSSAQRKRMKLKAADEEEMKEAENNQQETEKDTIPKSYESLMEFHQCIQQIQRLGVLVAHVVMHERPLHEVRLVRGRVVKQFTHPSAIFAQFRTSEIKAMFQPKKGGGSGKDPSKSNGLLKSGNANILDINKPGFHFYNEQQEVEYWHVHDPNEGDPKDAETAAAYADFDASLRSKKHHKLPYLNLTKSGRYDLGHQENEEEYVLTPNSTKAGATVIARAVTSSSSKKITLREHPGGRKFYDSLGNVDELEDEEGGEANSRPQSPNTEQSISRSVSSNQRRQHTPNGGLLSGRRRTKMDVDYFDELNQKILKYWTISKYFRLMFLVFENLRIKTEFKSFFEQDYQPPVVVLNEDSNLLSPQQLFDGKGGPDMTGKGGLSDLPMTIGTKLVEGQYYHYSDLLRLPRILDPSQDIYWLCSYIIEFLHKQTLIGLGFCPILKAEIKIMKSTYREIKQKEMKQKRYSSRIVSDKKQSSQQQQQQQQQHSNGGEGGGSKHHGGGGGVDLKERLNIAKQSAATEIKLHTLTTKYHQQQQYNNNIDKEMQLKSLKEQSSAFLSVVWSCKPKLKTQKSLKFTAVDENEFFNRKNNDDLLKSKMSITEIEEYIKTMKSYKQQQEMNNKRLQDELKDQQEIMITKHRMMKEAELLRIKEEMKEELKTTELFKKEWDFYIKTQSEMEQLRQEKEASEREEALFHEAMHIKDLCSSIAYEKYLKEIQKKEILELELLKISTMKNEKEVEIIRKQLKEEEEMKCQEEKRRFIEEKKEKERLKLKKIEDRRRMKVFEDRDRLQARLRRGNFMWHNGIYGFYDNVRENVMEWIQYEDEHGIPYYYDPQTNTTQYRLPMDAPIRHYTEDERKENDAIYGEGAYDAMKADRAYKDAINRDGRWWDETTGEFVEASGYYDENYEWVQNDGYYDEEGNYIRYAKVQGDLSFMV